MGKSVLSTFLILFSSLLHFTQAQSKWDLQFQAGIMEHGSDVHSWGRHGQMITDQAKFGGGAIVGYSLNEHCQLRVNYWRSKLEGNDKNIENEYALGHEIRAFSFTSPLHEIGLSIEYHFLQDPMNIDVLKRKSKWSPYVLGGVALSYTDPAVNFAHYVRKGKINQDKENVRNWYMQIPLGLGVRYPISEVVFLSMEARGVLPLHDYLDGISVSANPNKNDAYQVLALGLGINIGAMPDLDKDGVNDDEDECPDVFGLKSLNGCPDTDEDGIADYKDECPLLPGLQTFKGCPDSDGDGIVDAADQCPELAGLEKYFGCPTPDSDGDGINDDVDQCPNIIGTINGCPDSDDDGVIDMEDPCPLVFGYLNGCPDADGDSIADHLDACPYVAGVASKNGCPLQEKKSASPAVRSLVLTDLYFETNSTELIILSRPRLTQIRDYASKYPTAHFNITGFADSRADDDYNINLSFKRAERIYNDLIKMGIDAQRLHINAMGESAPLGDNSTEEGRQMNRRVEVRSYGQN